MLTTLGSTRLAMPAIDSGARLAALGPPGLPPTCGRTLYEVGWRSAARYPRYPASPPVTSALSTATSTTTPSPRRGPPPSDRLFGSPGPPYGECSGYGGGRGGGGGGGR